MYSNLNYYELLGIKEDASEDEIKQAYKKQIRKWHPDINKSDDAITMSSRINEAKEILLDPVKRYDYNEYLKKKITENYNRYTQRKNYNDNQNKDNQYKDEKVTKWQYLKEWLKYAKISPIKKLLGTIGVMIETLLCFLIKVLLITVAYIANIGSYFIKSLYSYLSPIIGLFIILFIIMGILNGFKQTINENPESIKLIAISSLTYIISIILPKISEIIISPKVFNILYNKIDISLFKFCVGYKE